MQALKILLANIVVLCSMVWCGQAADAATFMGLGFAHSPESVSDDGLVVVGTSGNEAFRWTQVTGMVGLGRPPGLTNSSRATDVSGDGSVVVGRSYRFGGSRPPIVEAVRWTQSDDMLGLGDLPGGNSQSEAYAVSADGSVVVGRGAAGSQSRIEAFRWTQTSGMVGLADLPGGNFESYAYAVSADGSVIAGSGFSATGREAFRWRQTSGMVGLGDLPGGAFDSSASDVSADGSVVVGFGTSASGQEAFRWTPTSGMVGLGDLPGGEFSSTATAVSADGPLLVGRGNSAAGEEAFLWHADHGMSSLRDVLVSDFGLGTSLAGWTLTSANDISADGQFIVGTGTNPNGDTEAWIARLATSTLPGDYNGNATVDAADYVVWRDGFGTRYTQTDYDMWRANFGTTAASTAVRTVGDNLPSVPEPCAIALCVVAMLATSLHARSNRKL